MIFFLGKFVDRQTADGREWDNNWCREQGTEKVTTGKKRIARIFDINNKWKLQKLYWHIFCWRGIISISLCILVAFDVAHLLRDFSGFNHCQFWTHILMQYNVQRSSWSACNVWQLVEQTNAHRLYVRCIWCICGIGCHFLVPFPVFVRNFLRFIKYTYMWVCAVLYFFFCYCCCCYRWMEWCVLCVYQTNYLNRSSSKSIVLYQKCISYACYNVIFYVTCLCTRHKMRRISWLVCTFHQKRIRISVRLIHFHRLHHVKKEAHALHENNKKYSHKHTHLPTCCPSLSLSLSFSFVASTALDRPENVLWNCTANVIAIGKMCKCYLLKNVQINVACGKQRSANANVSSCWCINIMKHMFVLSPNLQNVCSNWDIERIEKKIATIQNKDTHLMTSLRQWHCARYRWWWPRAEFADNLPANCRNSWSACSAIRLMTTTPMLTGRMDSMSCSHLAAAMMNHPGCYQWALCQQTYQCNCHLSRNSTAMSLIRIMNFVGHKFLT